MTYKNTLEQKRVEVRDENINTTEQAEELLRFAVYHSCHSGDEALLNKTVFRLTSSGWAMSKVQNMISLFASKAYDLPYYSSKKK